MRYLKVANGHKRERTASKRGVSGPVSQFLESFGLQSAGFHPSFPGDCRYRSDREILIGRAPNRPDNFITQNVFRTLIVDDEPIAREVLRVELAEYRDIEIVAEADNGLSAIGLIQQLTPDLVFLDLQMPRMTGLEVVRATAHGGIRIVVVTACERRAVRAVAAGAVGYLLKPVNPTSLGALLDKFRGQHGGEG